MNTPTTTESFQTDCERSPEPLLPVFLISYNRGALLEKAISSIRRLSRKTEIIVHDNGSDHADTLIVLDKLEKSGMKVYRHPPISHADDLNQVNDTVIDYFRFNRVSTNYVVSDCDIDMSVSSLEAIDVYEELLTKYEMVDCVGPMLRILDIPKTYPLYNHVMNRHIEQFWQHSPSFVETSYGKVAVQVCLIDTTFAIHRAGQHFRRLKPALRVYEPFEALHLDWYEVGDAESKYHTESNSNIAHWNNKSWFDQNRDAQLKYASFKLVQRTERGELVVITQPL